MVDNGLTQTYTLQLTLQGPCFTGSGARVSKKEYYYNARNHTVSFYDANRLMDCVLQYQLGDQFVEYMLGPDRTLYDFFHVNGGPDQFAPAFKYQVDCGDAIFGLGNQPADILMHSRNAKGELYIPGSSVKGMLRTAITAACVLQKTPEAKKPSVPECPVGSKEYRKLFLQDAKDCMRELDKELFHTLKADQKKAHNAVNSIFRGISIADSQPLSNKDIVLCRKLDRYPAGGTKGLNVVRECLRPGLKVNFPITFDPTLAGFVTPQFIMEAIGLFDGWYTRHVYSKYRGIKLPKLKNHLFLGGGSGYPSKTVTGPWLQEEALHYVTALLTLQFKEKNAADESRFGVSPHMLKCTAVDGQDALFGLCEVNIL